jgi:hypothetical protein
MSDTLKSSPSESMKQLTEKVLKADLASRKSKMLSVKAGKLHPFLVVPLTYYVVKVTKHYNNSISSFSLGETMEYIMKVETSKTFINFISTVIINR